MGFQSLNISYCPKGEAGGTVCRGVYSSGVFDSFPPRPFRGLIFFPGTKITKNLQILYIREREGKTIWCWGRQVKLD